ncbi:MAG TPA: hypothetical protein VNW92_13330, partial [Polyangiaceae bacterium]|nr:hypothetical protein [Polyangiaceae bacterium]
MGLSSNIVRFALTSAMVTGCHSPSESLRHWPVSSPTALAPSTAMPPALPAEAYFRHWEYHYNRNALTASAMVGGDLIAITAAGHLLRFNAETLKLEGELLSRRMARVLGGATDHDVLVGFESGRIARLVVPTLELTTIGSVPGVPSWVGVSKGEVLVIYGRAGALPRFSGWAPKLRWLGSRREVSVPNATAFFLDAEDRLWLGEDHGEWGGALTRVDLKGGQAAAVRWPTAEVEDIYGFAEVAPGEVWALGGMQHMMSDALVLRIAPEPTPTTIYSRATPLIVGPKAPAKPAEGPGMPITQVVDDGGGKLIAFAYDGVYEADRNAHFRRLGALHLKYHLGRPDAVGSYPALSNALVAKNRLILTTKLDGLATWQQGAPVFHTLVGELGVEPEEIVPSHDVLLVDPDHAARWNGQSWTLQALPAEDDDRDPSAPANADADRALASELAARQHDAQARPYWRVRGNPEIYDSIGWDAQHALLATEHGLCLLPLAGSDECAPLALGGIDDVVRRLKRDNAGRLWLAGRGLWYLRGSERAVSVHRRLPFTADT